MAVGTALAIGMAASAAAQAYGAHRASGAAKDAAKTQQRGADRALTEQRRVYDQQLQVHQPWVQMGQQAARTLGGLMLPGVPYTPARQAQHAALEPQGLQPVGSGATPVAAVNRAMPQRRTLGSVMVR